MDDWILDVWGDFACFTRPEMKVERVSYDVMTPSSARAIFEAIFWKPAIVWHITKIEVLHPINWYSLRRNELGKISSLPTKPQIEGIAENRPAIFIEDARQQRAGLLLRDVHYRIHGYFSFIPVPKRRNYSSGQESGGQDESPSKYAAMFERRARKGQCFHRPYLGCREFACYFRLVDASLLDAELAPIEDSRDLGWMLYDMNYSLGELPVPEFFEAKMIHGIIDTDRRSVEVRS
ncbi:type I-C CRISPR-associated protein Cas5c [uncultured Sphaerochaeta sp.]|uniref:type I-C CRISPR-associated protein Cas5c n=1 Tax=uncultured Sphaerochaeta sp. TaxID=886478 RepID=UPI002A0A51EB|nr:type I-C CRISPR-associated protein Cas5c [uncultured Sphaerochaeta sp.]